jgi:peptide subunit release factor 1 (eRF1)
LTGSESVADFVAHVAAPRRVGVLLVRLGGYAAGVFEGRELVSSKVGSRPVHGRAAAGGWSQQRFARRREGQARVALEAAADAAVAVLLPVVSTLDAVVTGGDRQALRAVLGDVRLAALESLVSARVLDVPDPKAKVLRESIEAALAVRVRITDPV